MPSFVLATRLIGHSLSCFLEPWSSGTYNPEFCTFCLPVPDSNIHYINYLLFCPCAVGDPAAVCVQV